MNMRKEWPYVIWCAIGLICMALALWQQHLEVQTWRAARDVFMDRCERLQTRLLEAERMNRLLAERIGKDAEKEVEEAHDAF
jgi:hypothetical protein